MAKNSRTARARAEAKAAEARSRQAEAEARRAEQETRKAEQERLATEAKLKAEREMARLKSQQDSQGLRAGATAAGAVAGIVAGQALAKVIDKRFVASVKSKNATLRALAKGPNAGTPAAMAAARSTGIHTARAPRGVGFAAALIAEAAFTRFVVSPKLDDSPKAQAIADAVASGSTLAAFSMLGKQSINRGTPSAVIDAKALAAVNAPPPAPPATPAPAAKAPRAGSKAALMADAKAQGIKGASRMTKPALQAALAGAGRAIARTAPALAAMVVGVAGYSSVSRAGGSREEAAKAGATAAADTLSGGAVSAHADEMARSGSRTMAGIRAVVEGGANILTFGLAGMMSRLGSGQHNGYRPDSVRRRAYLNAAAANAASETPAAAIRRPSYGRPRVAGGKISYATLDGRTVEATHGQAARWMRQRKG